MVKKKTSAPRRRPAAAAETDQQASAEVQSAEQQVEAAREQLRAAEALLAQAREKAAERVAWLREKSAGELIDTSLDFVRRHPGLGVLAAASIGYFLGRLFRR